MGRTTRSFHRHVVNPTDDISGQSDEVKAICNVVHTDTVKEAYKTYRVYQSMNMPYMGKSTTIGVRQGMCILLRQLTTFSGTDTQNLTLTYTDGNFVDVYLNGVLLKRNRFYASSGTSVVLTSGAVADDIVEIIVYDTFAVANHNRTDSDSRYVNIDGDTMTGALAGTTGGSASPSFTFSGDTDTGIFRTAANTIGFTAGGTETVQIGSFGVAADTLTNKTASGGITIDAAGDITLDADGADIIFKMVAVRRERLQTTVEHLLLMLIPILPLEVAFKHLIMLMVLLNI